MHRALRASFLNGMRTSALFLSLGAFLSGLTACDVAINSDDASTKVNGSIHVAAGKPAERVATVNGSIHVDDNATVTSAKTVNGSIQIGAHATTESLTTVNGAITVSADAHVGDLKSVNGDLTVKSGAEVKGSLVNVNGKVAVDGAHISGEIRTVSADISVFGPAHVDGGIYIEKPGGFSVQEDPTVVIGPGAVVSGTLRFERKVHLYVSDHATVGTIEGATATSFSGDQPPSK
jgi:DUF4097 and DUF4098 domain-containing protein YvlB